MTINYEKIEGKSKLSVSKIITMVYFITIFFLGISYVYSSRGGNLGTALAFVSGNRDINVVALIYTSVFEMIFEVFAILGSGLCIYMIFERNAAKITPYILIHVGTVISYILSRIALIQGVVHLSTQGAIKNTEIWDFQFIASNLFGINEITFKSIYLIAGLILILVLREKSNVNK